MVDFEIDVARIVNFDSFRAYRWLVSIAEPNPKLYGFLRDNGVDLNHVFNLLGGAIALCPPQLLGSEWSEGGLHLSPCDGRGWGHATRRRDVLDG